ncbi:type II toxin-antitoxin system HipA family toxin [Rathayibacter sp. VKM Ac-2760]|uniref:type II toxin-antitoxin system HipA family toxin n=1 Tax=Rathayibacter sp. VKM Ac-2760 TaxID=2609253 RepID=UPI00131697D2|nr:type II toxin-antitoxin system HipA family toxin [Rathayibacter sp. VKM Ac-2760]QHC57527.1 type II toxin-antitoxin system HipA family toxin [Rathayibacter sp. VKM Ac-2760]
MSHSLLIQLQSPSSMWIDVGVLTNEQEFSRFRSLESYWDVASRPVLGQQFEEHEPNWQPGARVALPSWFSHLLPEGRLRNAVAQAADVNIRREFKLLGRLGLDDLPGGIRAVKLNSTDPNDHAVNLDEHDDASADEPLLKFSLAGAQMKLSVKATDRGLTIPVSGQAGDFIMKLPDSRAEYENVPEAEFAAMELARSAGINTAETKLADARTVENIGKLGAVPEASLLIRRFDRGTDGSRVHYEELAQVMWISTTAVDAKYRKANFETVANYTAALCGVEAVLEVIDRIVLNVIIGNGDAHLKNWAYIYPDGTTSSLSPAYDIVPTVLFIPGDNLGLNLDGQKDFRAVTARSFEKLGSVTGLGAVQARARALEAVERVLSGWTAIKDLLKNEHWQRLNERLPTLSLLKS